MGNNRYAFHPSFELLAYKMLTDTDMMHLQILASYPALHSIFFFSFFIFCETLFFQQQFFFCQTFLVKQEKKRKRESKSETSKITDGQRFSAFLSFILFNKS